VSEAGGVRRYALPPGAGRYFFPREARLASDAEVFEKLRSPSFAYDDVAYVADVDHVAHVAQVAESPAPLPPPRARQGFAIGSVVTDEPERTEIATSCSDPGLLVLTRTFDPGWEASVDGLAVSVLRADLAFLALPVPAGEHRVVLTYAPRSWRIGRLVSLASLVLAAALWIAAPRRALP
jgi:hypothetical protein